MTSRLRPLVLALAFLTVGLGACTALPSPGQPTQVSLPLRLAWYEGHQVRYVTTDVSDAAMAKAQGVNHAPRLAQALPAQSGPGVRHAVERVYVFRDKSQVNVFPSIPAPAGAAPDEAYSPLWHLYWVEWRPEAPRAELRSEDDILAAEERGSLTLTPSGIVANCPVVSTRDGLSVGRLH